MPYPFMNQAAHRQLDLKLRQLQTALHSNPRPGHRGIAEQAEEVVRSAAEKKLVRPEWEQTWVNLKAVATAWFGDLRQDEEAQALLEVFVAIVRFIMDGNKPRIQEKLARELTETLDIYLEQRGHAAPLNSKGDGADPFAAFPRMQRNLLSTLHGKGKVAIKTVLKAIYSTSDTEKMETLVKLKTRTNKALVMKDCLLEIKKAGDTLELAPIA